MEKLVNCNIIIDIESIDKISGGNQTYEIFFSTKDKIKYKIVFNFVWEFRCSIENAYIDRFSNICHGEDKKSSIYLIQKSNSIKKIEIQLSGTRPIDELKNYILFDTVDTVIEVLTLRTPMLIKILD